MKFLILLLLLSSCDSARSTPIVQVEEYTFGDLVIVVSGTYKGCYAQILEKTPDKDKKPCNIHKYHANFEKNGLAKTDYVCHEDLAPDEYSL